MNHAKSLLGLLLIGLLTVGCAATSTKTAEDYSQALADAKTAISKAKSVNYEWRDTGKILKQAEVAAKASDYDKAVKLAGKAKRQGELAYLQYQQQKDAGPR